MMNLTKPLPRQVISISLALLTSSLSVLSLQAFYELAGGEVILHTRVSSGYDSNLFGNPTAEDDFFASIEPTFSWLRASGLSTMNASAGVNITRYAEFNDQSFEDYFGRFSAGFPIPTESALDGAFNIGYSRNTQLDEYVFDRVTTDTLNAGVNGAYQLRPRTSLTSSYTYGDVQTGDLQTVTNSGNLGISFSEIVQSLDLSFNYRIRHSRLEGNGKRDQLDHAFGANLSGPLLPEKWLPKVTTSFSLGYDNTIAATEEEDAKQRLVGSVAASWQARERTTVGVSLSRDLNLTTDQRNVETTNVRATVAQQIGERISSNANVGYSWSNFIDDDRSQETLQAGAGLSYSLNTQWNAGANYAYTKNITDEALREFDRHLVTLYTSYVF